MIVMIDNKDSFTYNVVDYLETESGQQIHVVDIEDVNVQQLQQLNPEAIVISPGPGAPNDYPILYEVMQTFESTVPMLGVCLGFQLIVAYYGGDIIKAPYPVHGHTTTIEHHESCLFSGLPTRFNVMRYHSLIADIKTIRSPLKITAQNEEGMVMAIEHQYRPIYGVQYHPESILSEYGHAQFRNFLVKAGVVNGCEV
ncbi:aminodeoxychorismate/anthranilate synthase component II [Staphylococcus felis]|uniref:Aminodeoxychorismate/anthranilate synthase component II n=1 Tax=Staphylococcus felis TaxID=46127 RepID=A0A2K3Z2L4_9STAP|nr:aminodeoxychorismate/anthranilate synthase component II [Staphylococcus felis]AVP35646.1 type 1 glutamine amidotransferase [Staphylococcus felis]MBH9580273.1 aminodeoxychorismate/anthranilate synthase component II [Staphylococcus felis]PNZ32113.1 aminodeoxychorismate/anthranilate synthase component II [Staphylococcus felis]QQB04366.1 aminodeoxychorismate/anthranilate synthase component II [Staphylococcus felis]REH76159.1 aminodeoxychorismate/anthranilate synthase component II [Staphylococcu